METIAAISTVTGVGGIGIVRMSGDNCFDILNKIFKPKNNKIIKGYTMQYGYIYDGTQIVDEVLVSYFKAPHSYTTENMCEINSHGGTYILRKILELCLKNGAILAEPGEFTKKAFLNGRMDLAQAESVIELINSKTEKEAQNSIKQLEGYLSTKIKKIRGQLMDLMVNMEVSIDYPEYDIEELNTNQTLETLKNVKEQLILLSKSFDTGRIIKEGINIALIGKPNAGKSSLMNRILKQERAIVTDIEGTTRDTIEESINLEGIPLKIIDTAGIREATNEVEKIGIEKSKKIAQEADLIIAIFDISKKVDNEDVKTLQLIKNRKNIILLNKIDLCDKGEIEQIIRKEMPNADIIKISIKEDIGIEKIYKKIIDMFNLSEININNSEIITNMRHKEIIIKSIEQTNEAIKSIENNFPADVITINVKGILEELGKITGESVTEDIIKEIFSKFCLGK